ncbi:DUF5658 family protein [Aquibacillus halophilus]|uniref:DUF5658 family protein n=1 Tax=Aquibacillus halophilus TaxID=930132 RepID=UPI003B83743D
MFRGLLLYLAVLNVLDCLVTFYGLKNTYITEFNPIMNSFYQFSPFLFILTKFGLSIFLLLIFVNKKIPNSNLLTGLAFTGSILYTFTFLLHGYWLSQVF